MDIRKWVFMLYLGSIVGASAEAIILIQNGNEYNFYLLFVAGLIVIAVLLQIVIQLDRLLKAVEGDGT